MPNEEDNKRQLLKGESNFLGWKKIMMAQLKKKKYVVNGKFSLTTQDDAVDLILCNLTLNIAGDIPDDKGPEVMWNWLESRFGDDNKWDLEREFKDLKMISIEPKEFLARVDNFIARIKAAGGKVSESTEFTVILNGIHQEFYLAYIRAMREEFGSVEITNQIIEKNSEET
jgi:hypothetical protein